MLFLHHFVILLHLFLLIEQRRLLTIGVGFLLLQNAQFLIVQLDSLPLFVHLIILVRDFFIKDGVIFHKFPDVCLRLSPDAVGCFQSVIESFIDFLIGGKGTSPSVLA
jgi:hypothetical protein